MGEYTLYMCMKIKQGNLLKSFLECRGGEMKKNDRGYESN
jgi:hypothetical protein